MLKQGLSFYAVYPIILIINVFPRFFLRILPPIVYFFLYYIFHYRKKVVEQNLKRVFSTEISETTQQYYQHLSRIIVEPLLTKGLSKEFFKENIVLDNNLMTELYDQGKSVFIVMGHCNNWEWLSTAAPLKSNFKPSIVYKKMSNRFFERFVNDARGKYGTDCVEMAQVPRYVMGKIAKKEQFVMSFVADQIPSHDNCSVVDFFNEKMYFFNGYQKLAQKGKIALVYFDCKIIDGKYHFKPILINDYSKIENDKAHNIKDVQTYATLLEESIKRQPYNWLWSHKRWKRIPEKSINLGKL